MLGAALSRGLHASGQAQWEDCVVKASVFIGTSLDGFIARANGDYDFLPAGGGEPHGYEEFMATVDGSRDGVEKIIACQ